MANLRPPLAYARFWSSFSDTQFWCALSHPGQFEVMGPIVGRYFTKARPAATAVIVGLIDARMKIEIEVTARRGSQ